MNNSTKMSLLTCLHKSTITSVEREPPPQPPRANRSRGPKFPPRGRSQPQGGGSQAPPTTEARYHPTKGGRSQPRSHTCMRSRRAEANPKGDGRRGAEVNPTPTPGGRSQPGRGETLPLQTLCGVAGLPGGGATLPLQPFAAWGGGGGVGWAAGGRSQLQPHPVHDRATHCMRRDQGGGRSLPLILECARVSSMHPAGWKGGNNISSLRTCDTTP